MTINELAMQLQDQINEKMLEFSALGRKAKETQKKIDKIYTEMGEILKEMQPVDALLRAQHPEQCDLFDKLLEILKESNGK